MRVIQAVFEHNHSSGVVQLLQRHLEPHLSRRIERLAHRGLIVARKGPKLEGWTQRDVGSARPDALENGGWTQRVGVNYAEDLPQSVPPRKGVV